MRNANLFIIVESPKSEKNYEIIHNKNGRHDLRISFINKTPIHDWKIIAEDLALALHKLLQDTQHSEHNCEDDYCPVKLGIEALSLYKAAREE